MCLNAEDWGLRVSGVGITTLFLFPWDLITQIFEVGTHFSFCFALFAFLSLERAKILCLPSTVAGGSIPGSSHLQMTSDFMWPSHHGSGHITSFQDVIPSNADLAVTGLPSLLLPLWTTSHKLRRSQLCTGRQSRLSRQQTQLKVMLHPPKFRGFEGRPHIKHS